jgi:hypothetical protein
MREVTVRLGLQEAVLSWLEITREMMTEIVSGDGTATVAGAELRSTGLWRDRRSGGYRIGGPSRGGVAGFVLRHRRGSSGRGARDAPTPRRTDWGYTRQLSMWVTSR